MNSDSAYDWHEDRDDKRRDSTVVLRTVGAARSRDECEHFEKQTLLYSAYLPSITKVTELSIHRLVLLPPPGCWM